eukprot:TRINITY_DN15348_c0_g1_i1.p1 TRINITY_DN15348_c0_g1~~TRINITY_DN15348_c0_g1_i1.p1  ORF type:complete len:145 (-),score=3.49 TRINITY_DN15348_c0_g1_i1:42-476(-)
MIRLITPHGRQQPHITSAQIAERVSKGRDGQQPTGTVHSQSGADSSRLRADPHHTKAPAPDASAAIYGLCWPAIFQASVARRSKRGLHRIHSLPVYCTGAIVTPPPGVGAGMLVPAPVAVPAPSDPCTGIPPGVKMCGGPARSR